MGCGGIYPAGSGARQQASLPKQMTAMTDPFNAIPAGYELDRLVAEKVMGETEPTFPHELAHLDPEKSAGGDWVCWPEYERGDVCEWTPLPFSTDTTAAWKVVDRFVPWVCRFKSADGFIHLSCGHWADHGQCVDYAWTREEEGLEDDPQPWSFHIHLGLLGENSGCPVHWKHQDRFCARAPTAALAICRAALKAILGMAV